MGIFLRSDNDNEQDNEDEDVLDNFCPSAHYLAHTEFGVTGMVPVVDSCLDVY
jgi:hypothetical protein